LIGSTSGKAPCLAQVPVVRVLGAHPGAAALRAQQVMLERALVASAEPWAAPAVLVSQELAATAEVAEHPVHRTA